ncbi:type III polyketide synthase [Shouchella lonarensis]|uniref:15-methylpalmitoyl-4-hydroxy-2-pyrone synthase n=1 Tax=Shouchella lonarensis TaxID=1464122 RepID=A0A1G6MPT6_9BACI|nr:3-oxoacyl-[acyl-carrier-protein] synthase III C-terminal domain-containing protein [Shouchella lonarensis]SDC57598.1 15-methylpalmitoyl-4-hydroxy-2-pyrone synthase [Shouchella lonarensis]
MSHVLSVSTYDPPYVFEQSDTAALAKQLFADHFPDIDRLLNVFANGEIKQRHFSVPFTWFKEDHSLQERNDLYIKQATAYGREVVTRCLSHPAHLNRTIEPREIDAMICVSSTGMSTPSLDARIMNQLPFSPHTKRIPLWGLGCAGGASGLSRAYEYTTAFPKSAVLLVCIELCGLTFQKQDPSKSNLIGTSLFADGVACALICGKESPLKNAATETTLPTIQATQSTLMPDSEEVMGWDVKDSGLHVVFARSIPHIVESWLKDNVENFLAASEKTVDDVDHFIAHPGGKKVITAYEKALGFSSEMTATARHVLQHYGNMSSPTVLYVLKRCLEMPHQVGESGLVAALGPGFCSELLLLEWMGD